MSIRACMIRAGYSTFTLADAIGTDQCVVAHWCQGKTTPCVKNVQRLCEVLGVDVSQLFRKEIPPVPDMDFILRLVDDVGLKDFMEQTGLVWFTVWKWRHGTIPHASTVKHLADTFGIPLQAFWREGTYV